MTRAARGNGPFDRERHATGEADPTLAQLIYLYCVVEADTAAEQLLRGGAVEGLQEGEPLFAVAADGLVAAVSRVPAATFQEEPLNALVADLPRLTPFVVRHEQAVRALLPAAPALIPLTFGAVYRDEARVATLLHERSDELRRLLRGLANKQEWGLKVFGESAGLLRAAEEESAELRRLADEAAQAGPGRAFLLAKRRERLLAGEAERLAAEAIAAIVGHLATLSADVRRDEALPPPRPGEPPLLLKAAFLVDRADVAPFRTFAAELAAHHGARGLRLEVSGPWAPYSFVKHDGG